MTTVNVQAMKMAKTKELLPMDRYVCVTPITCGRNELHCSCSSVWPMFFHKSLWNEVTQMTQIVSTVVRLCVSILGIGYILLYDLFASS